MKLPPGARVWLRHLARYDSDPGAVRGAQVRQKRLNGQEHAGHIGGESLAPTSRGVTAIQLVTLVAIEAGIADQQIDRLAGEALGKGGHAVGVADIEAGEFRVIARGAGDAVAKGAVMVEEGAADAAIGAGDDDMHGRFLWVVRGAGGGGQFDFRPGMKGRGATGTPSSISLRASSGRASP